MKNFISPKELILQLSSPGWLIADCRFSLDQPELGRVQYHRGHLPGAVYLSLEKDLSATVSKHGGRHPLPSLPNMIDLFSMLGVVRGRTQVVAYDDAGGAYAARLWWMLRYLGHDLVRVLDGGFSSYVSAGGDVTTEVGDRNAALFTPDTQSKMLVSMSEIEDIARQGRLVDARSPERFAGENETIDFRAGHIPCARNQFWMSNLDNNNHLLPVERLAEIYSVFPEAPVMLCGSGVTACINVLAMEEAGYAIPRLYVGSWSDWISYPENPIATGEV